MSKLLLSGLILGLASWLGAADSVLIVADEFPAMEQLAGDLKAETGLTSRIVKQTEMPSDLAGFSAVVVYIHLKMAESAENAFIRYAENGGKLIVLHHSISSGKRANKNWFRFLGVELPPGDVAAGGYKWTEDVTLDIVNLAPGHFITTNQVPSDLEIAYAAGGLGTPANRPGFRLEHSEVYLNHALTGPHTLLLGLKYTDAQTGRTWMQSHAGWLRPAGKGWIFYFLPGHSVRDFQHPAYRRILLNAFQYKP